MKERPIDQEERYALTPKGIALLALLRCGLVQSTADPRIEGFWSIFERDMENAGYVENGETKDA